jgi:thymidylate synthase (FAD)
VKVFLIAEPTIDWREFARFTDSERVQHHADPSHPSAQLAEIAGRICYMSYGKGRKTTKEFIDNIVQSGHHSVLEHANFTLFITGISRSCSHELVRHRHLSFSQLSQRYVDESNVEILMPELIGRIGQADVFHRAVGTARTAYCVLVSTLERYLDNIEDRTLRHKAARQIARSVLPNATETKIAVTGNVRAWRHFIQLRASIHADTEIRALAVEIFRILNDRSPLMFNDMEESIKVCAST